MTKPFGLRELLARIGAVLRRAEAAAYQMAEEPAAPEQGGPGRYRFGGWELDMRTRRLRSPDGAPVSLTKGEFSLLEAFLRAPRRVLSREQLLAATRLHEDEVYDRSIDVQILCLRRKLEADPSQPELIRTERGSATFSSRLWRRSASRLDSAPATRRRLSPTPSSPGAARPTPDDVTRARRDNAWRAPRPPPPR